MYKFLCTILFVFVASVSIAQVSKDTSGISFKVNGNIGITNNGISIIPTFSLGQPSFNISYSFSKGGRWSLDPDLRLTFDGTKGSAMVWLRYKVLQQGKFKLNIGMHPAFNFGIRTVTEDGKTWDITQARRFAAAEFSPSYIVNKYFSFGMYYLRGRGFQQKGDGPNNLHYVNFNTTMNAIPLLKGINLSIAPQVYYLKVDDTDGFYFTSNISIFKSTSPFLFMSTMNKEIRTNVAGSKNFDWNLSLLYKLNRSYRTVK